MRPEPDPRNVHDTARPCLRLNPANVRHAGFGFFGSSCCNPGRGERGKEEALGEGGRGGVHRANIRVG